GRRTGRGWAGSAHHVAVRFIDRLAHLHWRVPAHPRQHPVDIAAVPEVRALVRMQEALFDHAVDHPDQGRIEILDVEEGARLAADAELAPGEHLEDLLHGAEPAGQGDERVGQLEHAHLALVHGADDLQLGQALVRHFPVGQLLGDHPGDLAAGLQYRVGHGTHQPDVAAAIHQAQAVAGDAVAQGDGAFGIGRLAAGVGAAIDADRAHSSSVSVHGARLLRAWAILLIGQPGCSLASVRLAAASPDRKAKHDEGHADGAETRPAALDGTNDEEDAGAGIQRRSHVGRKPAQGQPQLALWMARLSTAMAASWIASDRVGWAWQMRARSSAEPLNSMVNTPSCTSSDALAPMMCRP